MEKKKIISIITFLIMIINIGIFAIPMFSQSASFQPEGSITVLGTPGVVWQDNFNPWSAPALPGGILYLIYEPLALVNYLNSQTIPWLATNWTFVHTYVYENKSGNIVKVPTLGLILNLRHDVYFTDGTPFNAT
ncbi:MAG: ABC transporter substrate-binding protein, partial [Saccharolobus sp.]